MNFKENRKIESDTQVILLRWKVVCVILLIVFIIASGFAIYQERYSEKYIQNKFNKFPFIDPARSFIAQENFITNVQPLREKLNALFADEKIQNTSTLYFETLNTGANISINPDLRVYPASLLKVPTAMAAIRKVEEGEWSLDDKLVLFAQDIDSGFGTHYKDLIGTTYTIEELIKFALIESDNTSNKILLRNLSIDEIAQALDAMGLDDLLDQDRKMTAREYSRIFRILRYSSFLNQGNSSQILKWLSETPFNDYLQSGIPENIVFSHKIGEDDRSGTYLDAGIIYAQNRPYLLTVAITGMGKEEAKKIMKKISQLTYEYVSNY